MTPPARLHPAPARSVPDIQGGPAGPAGAERVATESPDITSPSALESDKWCKHRGDEGFKSMPPHHPFLGDASSSNDIICLLLLAAEFTKNVSWNLIHPQMTQGKKVVL